MGARIKSWTIAIAGAFLPLAAGSLVVPGTPAHAQFSDGYKFLEAVRKKDGQAVADALNEPGSTIISARDLRSGQSALHIVTERRDLTWLRYLAAEGANVNARDNKGQTPLQLATSLGWVEGVEFLVASKADLDEANDTGETPLIAAVHRKDAELVRVLLQGGADPDRSDNSGRSARDYALLQGKDGALMGTIERYAKAGGKKAAGAIYGPVF